MSTSSPSPSHKRLRKTPSSSGSNGHSNDRSFLDDFLSSNEGFNDLFNIPEVNNTDVTKSQEPILSSEVTCNCKRSKCLKLYCDCFSQGVTCGTNCKCENCHNLPGYESMITKSRKAILKRNPVAFDKKIIHGNRHSRGCKCKSSKCIKKYCECFASGVECTEYCECSDCKNGKNVSYSTKNTVENSDILDFMNGLESGVC